MNSRHGERAQGLAELTGPFNHSLSLPTRLYRLRFRTTLAQPYRSPHLC